MVYMITYDLNGEGKDYEGVQQAIKDASDGTWCHICKSSWLIRSEKRANAIFESIQPFLDSDDRCFVVEAKNNKQGWLAEEAWKYINSKVFG